MIGKEAIEKVLAAELDAAIMLNVTNDGGTRKRALQYYTGELPGPDDPDVKERAAVSMDVADMIEAVNSQMMPGFSEAGAVEFEAKNEADEPAAKLESEIVRSMLIEGRGTDGGFVALTEGVKDALLMRDCVLALWVDRKQTRTPEQWDLVPGPAVPDKVAPTAEGQLVENVEIVEMTPDEIREAGAEPVPGEPLFKVTLTRVDVEKRLAVQAVKPEDFVTSSVDDRDPNRARFCADRWVTTRADLIAYGLSSSEVSALPAHDPSTYDGYIARARSVDMPNAAQTATEWVEVWRCYAMLADAEGSPRAERYRCLYSRDARKLLGKPERVGMACYALGQAVIFPHRMQGISLFDKLGEIQELKTLALRQWAENLTRVNRPRLGIDEALANMADAMDATKDLIRVKGPGAITPIPALDAGPSALAFIQYQDNARTERGGASLELQSATAQIATNQTASGIERQYSVKEQLAAMMARTFAETAIRGMFRTAHYLLRTQWGGTIEAKLGGKWIKVDPAAWAPRNGLTIRVGQSHTERMRKQAALAAIIQQQQAWAMQGKDGELTDNGKMYNAAIDWIAANQLQNPDRYVIDPSSDEARQAQQGKAKQAQQGQAQQAAMIRAQLMLQKYEADLKALTDTLAQIVKAATEEAKLTLDPAPLQAAEMVAGEQLADSKGDTARAEAQAEAGNAAG